VVAKINTGHVLTFFGFRKSNFFRFRKRHRVHWQPLFDSLIFDALIPFFLNILFHFLAPLVHFGALRAGAQPQRAVVLVPLVFGLDPVGFALCARLLFFGDSASMTSIRRHGGCRSAQICWRVRVRQNCVTRSLFLLRPNSHSPRGSGDSSMSELEGVDRSSP
jgi:hypothetical protein